MDTRNEDEIETPRPTGAWIICPDCSGDGHHAKHLGDFTMSEFEDCFDDPDDREAYFGGAYDRTCSTCGGTGKIREDDEDALARFENQNERDLIARTGRNSAGEPCF